MLNGRYPTSNGILQFYYLISSEYYGIIPFFKSRSGHNNCWRELTTTLLNAPLGSPLDLAQFRRVLANQLVATVKPREYNDKLRELERYLIHK